MEKRPGDLKQRFTNMINHFRRYLWKEKKWAIVIVIAVLMIYSKLQESHENQRPYFLIHVKILHISESTTTFRFDLINIGVKSASNFTMKSILIANSPRNAPILVDNFTAANEFPYNIGPHRELRCKCIGSNFYLVSILKYRGSELNQSFTQGYIARSVNNRFTHHMDSKEKKELEYNIKSILSLETNEDNN
jgi:hypothetical protein